MFHVLNYGMGVESTAILLRWIFEPDSRPFKSLSDLVVMSAQTGDEFGSTKTLVDQFIIPLLRKFRIRFVQVAKHGPYEKDGYTVLEDSTSPSECLTDGDYKMSSDLIKNGTVPLYSGAHTCAIKWKGWVLEQWVLDHLPAKFGPYLGYSADETKRAAKCEEFSSVGNVYLFPLIEWEWTRLMCLDYIHSILGVPWLKSCCSYCPFIAKEIAASRYKAEPLQAGFALYMEAISLRLNPRMQLFSHGSAFSLCHEFGITEAIDEMNRLLDVSDWAIYRVERTWEKKTSSRTGKRFTAIKRRIAATDSGSRSSMELKLHTLAKELRLPVIDDRVWSHTRSDASLSCEGFWVAAPDKVQDKVQNEKTFLSLWQQATGEIQQLTFLGLS